MLGFSTYAALLPELRDEWQLSNAQAGVIGGMFFAGYVATVSYWTALTDRVDARKIYLAGGLKIVYDLALYFRFRRVALPADATR